MKKKEVELMLENLFYEKKQLLSAAINPENLEETKRVLNKLIDHETTINKWGEDEGDRKLRLNYELDENSVVFDLGGYKGTWAADIYCMYGSKIHIFEPLEGFCDIMRSKFKVNKDITINIFGLSNMNKTMEISCLDDASTVFGGTPEDHHVEVKMVDIVQYINQSGIPRIDLMKINIEGGEYDVLERLAATEMLNIVTDFQIQFHDFIPNCKSRREAIQAALSKTHYQTYNYDFVWENWTRK